MMQSGGHVRSISGEVFKDTGILHKRGMGMEHTPSRARDMDKVSSLLYSCLQKSLELQQFMHMTIWTNGI